MAKDRDGRGAEGRWARPLLPLVALALALAACSCPDRRRGRAEGDSRPVWLEACLGSPARLWSSAMALGGAELEALARSGSLDALAARLAGLPEAQLRETVDLALPLAVLALAPAEGEELADGLVVVASRRARGGPGGQAARHELAGRGGRAYLLEARGGVVALGTSGRALDAALGRGTAAPCVPDPGGADLVVEVASEALRGGPLRAWVARQGAALEASARRASAGRAPSALGDPEALARLLGRGLEGALERAAAEAPYRLELRLGDERLEASLAARGGPGLAAPPASSPREQLALMAPDSYLVVSSRASAAERTERTKARLEGLARVAGDERLGAEELARIEEAALSLSASLEGWLTVALRPGLEPGPLVVVGAAESPRPERAGEALARAFELADRGYVHELADHLGASVSLVSREAGTGGGAVRLAATAPSWVEGERGAGLRRLVGPSPALAYRAVEGTLLLSVGQGPERELARLVEAREAGAGGSSALAQPLVAAMADPRPGARLLVYGSAAPLAALPTRGGPAPGALAEGGLALSMDAPGGRRRVELGLGAAEVRSLLRASSPRSAP